MNSNDDRDIAGGKPAPGTEIAIVLDEHGVIRWRSDVAAHYLGATLQAEIFPVVGSEDRLKLTQGLKAAWDGQDLVTVISLDLSGRLVPHSVHLFRHENQIIFLAQESSEEREPIQSLSSLLSLFERLYRESTHREKDHERRDRSADQCSSGPSSTNEDGSCFFK